MSQFLEVLNKELAEWQGRLDNLLAKTGKIPVCDQHEHERKSRKKGEKLEPRKCSKHHYKIADRGELICDRCKYRKGSTPRAASQAAIYDVQVEVDRLVAIRDSRVKS